jgi:hypothetical protein
MTGDIFYLVRIFSVSLVPGLELVVMFGLLPSKNKPYPNHDSSSAQDHLLFLNKPGTTWICRPQISVTNVLIVQSAGLLGGNFLLLFFVRRSICCRWMDPAHYAS